MRKKDFNIFFTNEDTLSSKQAYEAYSTAFINREMQIITTIRHQFIIGVLFLKTSETLNARKTLEHFEI